MVSIPFEAREVLRHSFRPHHTYMKEPVLHPILSAHNTMGSCSVNYVLNKQKVLEQRVVPFCRGPFTRVLSCARAPLLFQSQFVCMLPLQPGKSQMVEFLLKTFLCR